MDTTESSGRRRRICLSWLHDGARAAASGVKHKSCILLWMEGGPSQKDTFDMKPGTKNAGEFTPIETSVPGIQISEHFPKFAKVFAETDRELRKVALDSFNANP